MISPLAISNSLTWALRSSFKALFMASNFIHMMPRLIPTIRRWHPQKSRSFAVSVLNRRLRLDDEMTGSVTVALGFEAFESSIDSFKNDAVPFDDLSSVLDQSCKDCDIFSSFILVRLLQRSHFFARALYEHPTNA